MKDLRHDGIIESVGNDGNRGTCWRFYVHYQNTAEYVEAHNKHLKN